MTEKEEIIVNMLVALNEVFQEFKLTSTAAKLYMRILENQPIDKLRMRFNEIIAKNTTFPKPHEFISAGGSPQT